MDKLLYGVAYYDEYMPCDRLAKDVEMMKAAGINLVRIGEEPVHCKRWYNDGNVAFVLLQGRRLFEFTGRSITNRF